MLLRVTGFVNTLHPDVTLRSDRRYRRTSLTDQHLPPDIPLGLAAARKYKDLQH